MSIKVQLNYQGVGELLKEGMKPIVEEKAKQICDKCGEGYSYDVYTGVNRCNAMVFAETREAIIDNEQNNTILGALF